MLTSTLFAGRCWSPWCDLLWNFETSPFAWDLYRCVSNLDLFLVGILHRILIERERERIKSWHRTRMFFCLEKLITVSFVSWLVHWTKLLCTPIILKIATYKLCTDNPILRMYFGKTYREPILQVIPNVEVWQYPWLV